MESKPNIEKERANFINGAGRENDQPYGSEDDSLIEDEDLIMKPSQKSVMDYLTNEQKQSLEPDKYKQFNEWCEKEGVKMPNLKYPAFFEDGLIGMECLSDIHHRQAFIFVPYKMHITIGKAKTHPVLSKIIEENPEMLSKANTEWELMILVLFLLHETTLGTQSYWFPYLRAMPQVEFTFFWD